MTNQEKKCLFEGIEIGYKAGKDVCIQSIKDTVGILENDKKILEDLKKLINYE